MDSLLSGWDGSQNALLLGGGLLVVLVVVLAVLVKRQSGQLLEYDTPTRATIAQSSEKPLDFNEHLSRGNECLVNYHLEDALAHFQAALALNPKEPTLHFKIGRIFVQQENERLATQAFQNVLLLEPNHPEAGYELARLHHLRGDTTGALSELDKLLKHSPEHLQALRLKLRLLIKTQQHAETLPLYETLMHDHRLTHEQRNEYRAEYTEALVRDGQVDRAIALLQPSAQDETAVKLHRLAQLGKLYFSLSRYEEAVSTFRTLVEASKQQKQKLDEGVQSQMAAALCNVGVLQFEKNDWDSAHQYYQEALSFDRENPDIYFNLGKLYAVQQQRNSAIEHFESALALNPEDDHTLFELGALYDLDGRSAEAVTLYERCLTKNPRFLKAHFCLGTLYGVQGQLEQAIHYLSQAVMIQPNFIDGLYNLAVALERKGDRKKAAKLYQQVLKINKNHVEAKSNLALLQKELKTTKG
ncbi:MAG: tetratricopeptide repeat protein [Candidatus Melainabacteria bacterium]|nr:tetratricopeptide repeat protein [Candidatus Melainabacteria bacterium]